MCRSFSDSPSSRRPAGMPVQAEMTSAMSSAPTSSLTIGASSDAVAAVRSKSDTSDVIATVDHARAGNGPAIVVLAVEGLLDNRVGHYGISAGATATVPRVLP